MVQRREVFCPKSHSYTEAGLICIPSCLTPKKSFLAAALCSSVRKASHPPLTVTSHVNVSSSHPFSSSLPHSSSHLFPAQEALLPPSPPFLWVPGLTHRHLGKGGQPPPLCERGVLTA